MGWDRLGNSWEPMDWKLIRSLGITTETGYRRHGLGQAWEPAGNLGNPWIGN